jgi:hypothetical protein
MPCLVERIDSTCSEDKARSVNLRRWWSPLQREKSNGGMDNEANQRLAVMMVLADG